MTLGARLDSTVIQIATGLVLADLGAFSSLLAFTVTDCIECSVWIIYAPQGATNEYTIRVRWFPISQGNIPTAPQTSRGVILTGTTLIGEDYLVQNTEAAATPYNRVLSFKVPAGATFAEFQVAETGDIANPGTITAAFASCR